MNEKVVFSNADLYDALFYEYCEVSDRGFVVCEIPPDLFRDVRSYLRKQDKNNEVDKKGLYDHLSSLGYNSFCLEDVERCFPKSMRDAGWVRETYRDKENNQS